MININKKLFLCSIISIIGIEILSFLSFAAPVLNPWIFGLAALAALVLTVYKLEWGVYLIFAELAVGSFGKLFVLQIEGVELSIRIVLWLVVMSVWLAKTTPFPLLHLRQPALRRRLRPGFAEALRQGEQGEGYGGQVGKEGFKKRVAFFHSQFFKPYLALAVVLGWGIVWGLGQGHDFGAVFFDVNNYLYFLLIFPVYEVLSRNGRDVARNVSTIATIIMAVITWLSIKTIILFYIFSHEFFWLQDILYDWSRKFQLAEITNIDPAALTSRVFIQSQIWVLFGLFVALGVILSKASRRRAESVGMTVLMSTALIMSFSRSFWLAGVLSLAIFLILLLIQRERFSRVFYFGILSIVIAALGVGLALGVAAFPIPRGAEGGSSILKERVEKFKEAAASSRMSQIRPLLTAIANHPAIGSGFGQTATYQSQDPRIIKSHPDGWYTTTAFELGWLEIWLKIGLLGVLAYLYLLWRILKSGWQSIKDKDEFASFAWNSRHSHRFLILAAMAGLIAIVITHGVSPYLNHPLGIGVVLLLTCAFDSGLAKE